MFSQYGELWPTNGWDRLTSLGHPCKFQRVSRLRNVTERHSSSGRQPNFAGLNRGRHLCSAGRPSRWTLAHISSWYLFYNDVSGCFYHFLNKIELCWGATRCVILPNFNLFGAMFMCTIKKAAKWRILQILSPTKGKSRAQLVFHWTGCIGYGNLEQTRGLAITEGPVEILSVCRTVRKSHL